MADKDKNELIKLLSDEEFMIVKEGSLDPLGKTTHALYSGFLKGGFTEDQAMELAQNLLIALLQTMMKMSE